MTKQIQFFDTTLRDGEQTPGVNFNTAEKVRIALQLEKWGVDVIEAGFPISSQGDFEAVSAIAKAVKKATVGGLARCNIADIDSCYQALKEANHKQVHVFIATSPIHRESKLMMNKEQIIESVKKHVTYASSKFDQVQFSPEDATRTEWDFLATVIETAIQAGANVINIPDTVGYTNPTEYGQLFAYLVDNVPSFDQAIFSSHCHDDLGMAVANALSAIEHGALRVEGTVNGIGERAGNTALEEVAVALHIRKDFYQADSNIILNETKNTSDLISRLSGMPVPRNKAIIGANAYAHESGIHQDGVLKNPETYEIITPQLVGVPSNHLPLGKLSGRHAFINRLESLGYKLTDQEEIQALFKKFKDLADKKKHITELDLHALVTGQSIETESRYELVQLQVQYIGDDTHSATVAIKDTMDGDRVSIETGRGAGSVDAIYGTINTLLNKEVTLIEYYIDAVTEGIDSQAQVHVTIQTPDNQLVNGTGIDFDVLSASAKAYLKALN